MGVPELGKPHGTACVHCTGSACGIYQSRPRSCRDFDCAYSMGVFGDVPELRPDALGVMLYAANTELPAFVLVETRAGALREHPVQMLREKLTSAGVRVVVRRTRSGKR